MPSSSAFVSSADSQPLSSVEPHHRARSPQAGSVVVLHHLVPLPHAGSLGVLHHVVPLPQAGSLGVLHHLVPLPQPGSLALPHHLMRSPQLGSAHLSHPVTGSQPGVLCGTHRCSEPLSRASLTGTTVMAQSIVHSVTVGVVLVVGALPGRVGVRDRAVLGVRVALQLLRVAGVEDRVG